jgi:hypothetical protein
MTRDIELSEKDLKQKQFQLDEYKFKLARLKLQEEQMTKTIKEELPMMEARLLLRQIKNEIEMNEQNVTTLTKQIREKKMTIIE